MEIRRWRKQRIMDVKAQTDRRRGRAGRIYWLLLGLLFVVCFPLLGSRYVVFLITLIFINAIAAQGLNFLTGYTGQLSLGHGAFLAIGAYITAILCNTYHCSFWVALVVAPLLTGLVGIFVALPALRLKGLYLAMITLAFHMVVSLGLMSLDEITGGFQGINVPGPQLGSLTLHSEEHFYYLALIVAVVFFVAAVNLSHTKIYRAFIAIKEKEISAQAMGISLWYYKTLAFFLASIYAGVAGCLFAVTMGHITPNHFLLMVSIEFIMMTIVGGPGSIFGIISGTALITLLPYVLLFVVQAAGSVFPSVVVHFADLKMIVYGLVIVGFLMYLPGGFQSLKSYVVEYWVSRREAQGGGAASS